MKSATRLRYGAVLALGVLVGAGAVAFLIRDAQPDAMSMGAPHASGGNADSVTSERRILYWRAPMDPNYTSDQPGKSPMGMDLVPVYEDEVLEAGEVRVSRSFLQNFAVRTAQVRYGTLPVSIRTVGILAHNEERVVSVQTKYEGWIERASVNNVGETVRSGDVLFEIYSPQLVATQREFLGAMRYVARLRSGGAYPEAIERALSLLDATRERLSYWDLTDQQIDHLAESKSVARTVPVFSPATGFIVQKMGDSMEGMKLSPGMTILKIADHGQLWAETEFYEDDLQHVRERDAVTIETDAFPGRRWDGHVLFFRPAVNSQTRTLTAFVEVSNPDLRLRPGMYVNVTAQASDTEDRLMVPTETVLHSGRRTVVIVSKGNGVFEPREVALGTESDGMQEVVTGLSQGENVVASSQFLIDSDANLRAAISQLLDGGTPMPAQAHH